MHHVHRTHTRRSVLAALGALLLSAASGLALDRRRPPDVVRAGEHALSGSSTPHDARAVPRTPREGPLEWGIYQILWGREAFERALDREIAALGSPHTVTFFRDLGRPYPRKACEAIIARGAIPIISLELQHWGAGRAANGTALGRIAEGAYDGFFARYAAGARDAAHDVWLRFGFEMNGDWFSWGCQPERFVAAWRRVHAIFQREGAERVVWVWAPNAISGPDTPENGFERYWPGGDVVDVIGLDGYNFGDDHSQWHAWTSCEAIFSPALEKIRASGVRHPVFVTELGCTDGVAPERRARWIRDAHAFLSEHKEISGVLWFNHDKRGEGEKNWRIDADAASLRAWRECFPRLQVRGASPDMQTSSP